MVDLERQRQRFHHILLIGVATHFWGDSLRLLTKSKQFNQSDITSDIAALTLTLSANAP